MRFISCSAGKVDISRQGQIFTRRSKETAVEDVNFYDRFHVRSLTRVLMWSWTRGALLWSKMRLWWQWGWLRNERRSPTDSSTRSILLATIFLLIFLVRLWFFSFYFLFFSPYTSISETIFRDSPFTLTFDKCSAIPLHFLKKSGTHRHILTFTKAAPQYVN